MIRTDRISVNRFPYRIGRESRLGVVHGRLRILERRELSCPPTNDLYLCDPGPVLYVSRQHFQIEQTDDGGYQLFDRGSTCGTIVGNQMVGGSAQGSRCTLLDGNVVVIGTSESPYVFKFFCPQPHPEYPPVHTDR